MEILKSIKQKFARKFRITGTPQNQTIRRTPRFLISVLLLTGIPAMLSAQEFKEEAIRQGMLTMRRVGILNVIRGVTSLEEALRVTLDD